MSEALGFYLTIQVLLSLSAMFLWLIGSRRCPLNFLSQLNTGYFLLSLSLVLPFLDLLMPATNPFGPVLRVWTEAPLVASEMPLAPAAIHWRMLSTEFTPSLGSSIPSLLAMGGVFAVVLLVGWQGVKLLRGFFTVRRLLVDAFLHKSCGRVKLWLSDSADSPFSFFTGKAHVVLPTELIGDPLKLKMALSHELQHHRQRDTLWVYLLEALRVFFGFNPLVQKGLSRISELQELACDEVLVGRKNLSPQIYGQCLYDLAEKQLWKQQSLAGAVGMAADAKFLRRRIEMMFQQRKSASKKALIAAVVLGGMLMSGAAWAVRGVISDQRITLAQAQSLAQRVTGSQEIPVVIDAQVLHWLNHAVGSEKSRRYLRESMERMRAYQAMIQSQLGAASLPAELMAVPLVESGFRNDVSSPYAAGIWQFIPETARYCGLEVSEQRDERWIPSRLTEAAVCYYQKLHAIFQDWHVALAAYNIGPRRMMGSISEAGHNDVLRLAREGKLGNEGRHYLPKVIAAMIILENPELVE